MLKLDEWEEMLRWVITVQGKLELVQETFKISEGGIQKRECVGLGGEVEDLYGGSRI